MKIFIVCSKAFYGHIKEIKDYDYYALICLTEDDKEGTTVYDAAIPRLRSIMISLYTNSDFIESCCDSKYKKHYTKIYSDKYGYEYLKHEVFENLLLCYDDAYDEGFIDVKLDTVYDIIDFFSNKLDMYMIL